MNKYKRVAILTGAFILLLNLVACGQVKEDNIVKEPSANQQGNSVQMEDGSDTKKDEPANTGEPIIDQPEISTQVDGDSGIKENESTNADEPAVGQQESGSATADEILDAFINGSIKAIDSTDMTTTFSITDLNMDSEEWDSYSVGEKVDLDNDGENELVICGPYGGMYLDARDGKVYEFAAGGGDALALSYVTYNGAVWIMYSNRMHTGYESYHMEKFEGADNLAAEINFSEELIDENNPEGKEKYIINGTEASYDEYYDLCSKIFAAEVATN